MFVLPTTRENILWVLPRKGIVAEIGVAEGNFTRHIIKISEPPKLHLIDPWEFQPLEDYINDPNNVSNIENQQRYEGIIKKYEQEIKNNQIMIHRDYSTNVVSQFEDEYFDWIFLDAMHTYDAVKIDLDNYCNKVKKDGFIFGHDFNNCPLFKHLNFGVVDAVVDFVKRTEWELLAITAEVDPSYILVRSNANNAAKMFILKCLHFIQGMCIEIRDFPQKNFFYKFQYYGGKDYRLFMSF